MPKRDQSLRVPASLVKHWIDEGQVQVVFKAGAKLLQLFTPIYLTFPTVYERRRNRPSKQRRMWVPAGSFLNSRWIPLGPKNSDWSLIRSLTEEELKERYLIIRVVENGRDRWVRLIYEIVSSRSQLLRQRVHIRSQYARERRFKLAVLEAVESQFSLAASGRLSLSREEMVELSALRRRLEDRLFRTMTSVQSRLGGRDAIVYIDAWVEAEGIRGIRNQLITLSATVNNALNRKNFDAHLRSIAERLKVYISKEIRRSCFWARYHIEKAAFFSAEGNVSQCSKHLLRAVDHLNSALSLLNRWDEQLAQEERKYIQSVL